MNEWKCSQKNTKHTIYVTFLCIYLWIDHGFVADKDSDRLNSPTIQSKYKSNKYYKSIFCFHNNHMRPRPRTGSHKRNTNLTQNIISHTNKSGADGWLVDTLNGYLIYPIDPISLEIKSNTSPSSSTIMMCDQRRRIGKRSLAICCVCVVRCFYVVVNMFLGFCA